MTAAWQGVNDARDLTFSAQADSRTNKAALAYYGAFAAYELNNVPPPGKDRVQFVLEDVKNACSWAADAQPRRRIESREQAALLRDIFGHPFRAVATDSSWQTPTVLQLAKTIYQERAFDRLAILGDALEEASCTNAEILTHCRGPGPHIRGCWVVDLLDEWR